tara:strand:- start:147 stop:809 length:663 start_codon:yes stop_codon:yes gene_type:complete
MSPLSDVSIFAASATAVSGVIIALINKWKSRTNVIDKKTSIRDLRDHDVFNTLKRVKEEVANMKFYTHNDYDRVKTRMCYDFTKHKVDVCSSYIFDLVDMKSIESISKDKLKSIIIEKQIEMHKAYIHNIRKDWLRRGINEEDVDYVIHLFETFRYDVVNSFEHRINSIFGASYHKSNFLLVLAVLEMWAMGIDLLPRDMQTTFVSLNGKFKNIKYEANR